MIHPLAPFSRHTARMEAARTHVSGSNWRDNPSLVAERIPAVQRARRRRGPDRGQRGRPGRKAAGRWRLVNVHGERALQLGQLPLVQRQPERRHGGGFHEPQIGAPSPGERPRIGSEQRRHRAPCRVAVARTQN